MTSSLRSRIAAAALLLAPVAALVAAQPAAAQPWNGNRGWGGNAAPARFAPQIFNMTPGDGAVFDGRGNVTISARFSGVDPGGVTFRLDGVDRTGNAQIGPNGIHFAQALFPGRHQAEVIVRDRAGNEAHGVTRFDVLDPSGAFSNPYGNRPGS